MAAMLRDSDPSSPSLSCVRALGNIASNNNPEKINSWLSFAFLYGYGTPLGGPLGLRNVRKMSSTVGREGGLGVVLYGLYRYMHSQINGKCF